MRSETFTEGWGGRKKEVRGGGGGDAGRRQDRGRREGGCKQTEEKVYE